MKNFTIPALIKSLVFPVFTFIYGLISLLGYVTQSWEGFATINFLLPLAMMLLGGVLPAFLTFFRDTHTEKYFVDRLRVFAVCYVLWYLIHFIAMSVISSLITFALIGGKLVFEILKVWDGDTTGKERAVMLLSDPMLYLFVNDVAAMLVSLGLLTLI